MAVALGVLILGAALVGASLAGKCQRITAPACRDMGYNATAMPNGLGHESQEEAAIQVRLLEVLVGGGFRCDFVLFFGRRFRGIVFWLLKGKNVNFAVLEFE